MEWILSDDGVICQVLDRKTTLKSVFIVTAFGIDCVRSNNKRISLNLLRSRKYFSQLSKATWTRDKLSSRDKLFLLHLILNEGDAVKAYSISHGIAPSSKYVANQKIAKLLQHPKTSSYIRFIMSDLLDKYQVNGDWWMKKAVESVEGKVKTPVQYQIFTLIGNMIPEIRKQINPKSGGEEDDYGKLPAPKNQIGEATFKDICPVCKSDTGKLTAKSYETGDEVEIECPICSKKKELPPKSGTEGNLDLEL